jgi:hypothetical protein
MRPNLFPGLPKDVLDVMESTIFTEYATVSAQGVPIDTPTYAFSGQSGTSIDIGTGLAYPAKAERARRNPKVGLLIEGMPGEPIVSIAALAAVRDANIQANADRYIAETIAYYPAYSAGNPWNIGRKAVYYWARMFVECTPKRILWWPNSDYLDQAPQRWEAPSDTLYPESDPAPLAKPSKAPAWPIHSWRPRAEEMLKLGFNAHLTLLDDEGFPLPIRVRSIHIVDEGFELIVPAGAPWTIQGQATLCFIGLSTFVGTVQLNGNIAQFIVERMLPVIPTMQDSSEIWTPSDSTYEGLMGRLEEELTRRGQPIPSIPEQPPQPTAGSLRRAERMARMVEQQNQQQGHIES